MNKICCKCKQSLSLEKFSKNKSTKDGYARTCKTCHNEYCKADYKDKKSEYKNRTIKNKKLKREWYKEYKKHIKCDRCPENHPAALDFHHINPDEKEMELSIATNYNWSIEHLKKEIDKCIILCANCHRKEHYSGIV